MIEINQNEAYIQRPDEKLKTLCCVYDIAETVAHHGKLKELNKWQEQNESSSSSSLLSFNIGRQMSRTRIPNEIDALAETIERKRDEWRGEKNVQLN